jgi:hypothetical protein
MTAAQRQVTWVLESDAFVGRHELLKAALGRAGHRVVQWSDEWWMDGGWPRLSDGAVVFHGSLGNAARIRTELPWRPGAFCDINAFHCSTWYPRAKEWLANETWRMLPANVLVTDPAAALGPMAGMASVFVRPDSPLKPFAGRIVRRDQITLAALDHGFYYDDEALPVVVAPVRSMGKEWRYVVADRRVVAGSAYSALDRSALADNPKGEAWEFASDVAARLESPERVYVLDICEADAQLRLLELNPFSGADLYACRCEDVVAAVSQVVGQMS